MSKRWILILVTVLISVAAAKVDLVTLPRRDSVQLTIYNSADLTLVREVRNLTVKQGGNLLQFAWENTLIDPTSLQMFRRPRRQDRDPDFSLCAGSEPGLWSIESG
jgi:hypothetical protein